MADNAGAGAPEGLELAVVGELLALLAHDLRNPLSALQSNLGFLLSTAASTADSREALEDGLVSCDGLAHIIHNIDLLGQIMRSAVPADFGTLELQALVEEVVASCGAIARSHEVTLSVAKGRTGTTNVRGSRDFLVRSLANLVRNSIQHSSAGTVVRISVRSEDENVIVRVEDAGVSPPASGEAVFTAAGQVAAKSLPNGRYSRGLGLFAARLAAEASRASVRVSKGGPGNAFELVVPRAERNVTAP